MSLAKSPEDNSPAQEEIYQAFSRSLARRKGFGIVFLQASPAAANRVIQRIDGDLPQKQIAVLTLDKPIDNLYELIEDRADRDTLNILFVQGLEKSLEPYIKPGYGGEGDYYNLDTVPTILSHLNQRRELFRDRFNNICFVFVLPAFAVKYIIRRAPDFFDWSAGVFDISADRFYYDRTFGMDNLDRSEWDNTVYVPYTPIKIEPELHQFWYNGGVILAKLNKLVEAISSFDKAIEIKPDKHEAWYNRGITLGILNRLVEAISSFDKAIEIKPDKHEAYYGRGIVLFKLGRLEEAIVSFDTSIKIKPDLYEAWYNRGVALFKLGRWEEAIVSFDTSIKIKPDLDKAWYNRGIVLKNLGRSEEAIGSFDTSIKIEPDKYNAWYNRGIALKDLGRLEEAIDSYQHAIKIYPQYAGTIYNLACAYAFQNDIDNAFLYLQQAIELEPDKYIDLARQDEDFLSMQNDPRFIELVKQT